MGVFVGEFLVMKEGAGFLELLDDEGVSVPDGFAAEEFRDGVVVATVGEDRIINLQPILDARLIVLLAVPRCGVHKPGAVFEGDVVGEDNGAYASGV
jgi:hypothetical protein